MIHLVHVLILIVTVSGHPYVPVLGACCSEDGIASENLELCPKEGFKGVS